MMTRAEFYHFLEMEGGLICSHRKEQGPVYKYGPECNEGWFGLIAELIQKLIDAGWTREIRQIKEKFGGLRFYAEGLTGNCTDIIMEYEALSFKVCEVCGSTEKVNLRGDRWVKTLCETCAIPFAERHSRQKM
ncbi:hypothetical protein FO440_14480 [Mucilaginibacter corticis]|uniref:Uncharacterized protein n=1 Tax=Mucilaginibacter corticis TaxID=2597670 RepID=A0A556MMF2_9SPHI|nr:hypothetical protein [Mucilaginibacter corticis]TSJ40939.1 hypothetical protein FO440_14480 [Mucilaginibacter corticis]